MRLFEVELESVTNRVLLVCATSRQEVRRQIRRGFVLGRERRHRGFLDTVYIGPAPAEGDA